MLKILSYFEYISTRDSDSTLIFLSEDAASKALQKQYKQISILWKKSPIHFVLLLCLFLCHFFRRTEDYFAYCTLYFKSFPYGTDVYR